MMMNRVLAVILALNVLRADSPPTSYGANVTLQQSPERPASLDAISVAADGTVFATGGSAALAIIREGKITHQVPFLTDESSGGPAIASTAQHVIVPVKKNETAYFRRYDHQGQEITWPTNIETLTEELNLPSIDGLWAHRDRLYISSTRAQQIVIIDLSTGKKVRSFGAYRPHDLVVINDVLYVNEAEKLIIAYTLDGQLTGQKVGDDFTRSVALSVDQENRLVIADAGDAQQLLFYNISHEPRLIRQLGEENGVYGEPNPGMLGPFRHINLAGAGVDGAGRLYTLSRPQPAGFLLRCYRDRYTPPVWESFVSEAYPAATAQLSGSQTYLYSATNRYKITNQDSKPQIRWDAHLLNPLRYPDDPRRYFPVRDIQLTADHSRLITMGEHWASLNPITGATTRPQLLISSKNLTLGRWKMPHQPADTSWLWRDQNSDGQPTAAEYQPWPVPLGAELFIDAQSGLWALDQTGTLWHSSVDNPTTLLSHSLAITSPARFFYDPVTDQLTLWTVHEVRIFANVSAALKSKTPLTTQSEWNFQYTTPSLKINTARWDGHSLWVQETKSGSIYEFTPGSNNGRVVIIAEPSTDSEKITLPAFQTFSHSSWGRFFLWPDPHTGLGLFWPKKP